MKNILKHFAILLAGIIFLTCHNPSTDKIDNSESPTPPPPIVDIPLEGKYLVVTFEANGGTPIPHEQDLVWGAKIIAPAAMSKDDCGFGGWFTDETFTTMWNFAEDTVNKDITLYAKWIATHYCTVTFDTLGGDPVPPSQKIAEGGKAVRPLTVSNIDYGFGGWFTNIDFVTEWDFDADTISEDITLYAKWDSTYRTVVFIPNGGIPAPTIQALSPGTKVIAPLPMRKPNYSFGGWYKELELINQWDFYNDAMVDDDITLYAKWVTSVMQITGGSFMMGTRSTEAYKLADETPQHQATVSSFLIGKYPVTQEQYETVMGINPSEFAGNANNPVEKVTWYDALEFCNKLSVQEGLDQVYTISSRNPASGYPIISATVAADFGKSGYRLPTEAEWEYACRGDYPNKATETATMPFGVGDGKKIAGGLANFIVEHSFDAATGQLDYNDTSAVSVGATTPVGSYPANNYGLYDMHGNVWEWCWDWYNQIFYQSAEASVIDTRGPSASSFSVAERTMRGGSWGNRGYAQRSAYRNGSAPSTRSSLIGFRVARRL